MEVRDRVFTKRVLASQLFLAGAFIFLSSHTMAQNAAPGISQVKDPVTGELYTKSVRTVQRTVMDTITEPLEQTFYRPETVTETTPEVQTVYAPVTETKWRPYLLGRWNPFRQPSVAYRPVAETHWERRNQVINRTTSTTRYVPEKRTVQVARTVPKTQTQQIVSYQKISSGSVPGMTTRIEGVSEAVASRLQPISADQTRLAQQRGAGNFPRTIATAMPRAAGNPAARVAAASIGRMTSDPPQRSVSQSGLRANDLTPSGRVLSQPLPPNNSGTGIANLPGFFWR